MTTTKQAANNLLEKWEITSPSIKKIVLNSSDSKRYQILGWIDINKNLSEKLLYQRLKTYNKKWDSDLYKDQKENILLELKQLITPPEIVEGAYKCRKCGSERTVHVSLQLRSCDEGMTNFITCVQCGERWKE